MSHRPPRANADCGEEIVVTPNVNAQPVAFGSIAWLTLSAVRLRFIDQLDKRPLEAFEVKVMFFSIARSPFQSWKNSSIVHAEKTQCFEQRGLRLAFYDRFKANLVSSALADSEKSKINPAVKTYVGRSVVD